MKTSNMYKPHIRATNEQTNKQTSSSLKAPTHYLGSGLKLERQTGSGKKENG